MQQAASAAEVLRRRGVGRLVYFHCDHFEPWRNAHGGVSEKNAAHILRFAEAMDRLDYARKLTLFYRPHLSPTMAARRGAVFADDTPLGFVRPLEDRIAIARAGIGHIAANTAHEIQVHLHHEHVTGNDRYCLESRWGADFFRKVDTPEMDGRRFDLLLRLSLETIERESGVSLQRWFFIHGNWALNGSDPDVCRIDDEIERLQRQGCIGDFTFPAEPPLERVNPAFEEPAFIVPFTSAKCYDRAEARPEPAAGARARDPRSFFIWATPRTCPAALDYVWSNVRELGEDPIRWALTLAETAPVLDGAIYVRTYAHSMKIQYTDGDRTVFPLEHAPARAMLSHLFDGATDANAGVEFLTAREAYCRITGDSVAPHAKIAARSEDAMSTAGERS